MGTMPTTDRQRTTAGATLEGDPVEGPDWLERPNQERLGLGPHLPEVHRGLEALRRAEEAGR